MLCHYKQCLYLKVPYPWSGMFSHSFLFSLIQPTLLSLYNLIVNFLANQSVLGASVSSH